MPRTLKTQFGLRPLVLPVWLMLCGCGTSVVPTPPRLFYVPLTIQDQAVDSAFLDTGGEFEVLLKSSYGLSMRGEVNVLAYTGQERVAVTEPFVYTVGDVQLRSEGAIVGLSVCDCNGVGLGFLHKARALVSFNFKDATAEFVPSLSPVASYVPSSRPIGPLSDFRGVFIDVEVGGDSAATTLQALLDTGATRTVMRRDIAAVLRPIVSDTVAVTIGNPYLGTAQVTTGVFDTPGLPDLIIGVDLMGAFADQWYMDFAGDEPSVWVVHPPSDSGPGGSASTQ